MRAGREPAAPKAGEDGHGGAGSGWAEKQVMVLLGCFFPVLPGFPF